MTGAVQDWIRVSDYLIGVWLDAYAWDGSAQVAKVGTGGFQYLFDVDAGRLLAAWGVSRGRHDGTRDKARMAGHPLGDGPAYHRGHAISHRLGGGTDINLVPQLGAVNTSPFRALERQAVATPGAFYFTCWDYRFSAGSQRPSGVDQGLLIPGQPPQLRTHAN